MNENPAKVSGTTSRFVKLILGFGVWVAIGLAPFLGRLNVPVFTAVIALYPTSVQKLLIPVSAFFMGMIAVVVEFASGEDIPRKVLAGKLRWSVWLFGVSLIALVGTYIFTVQYAAKAVLRDGSVATVDIAVITGTDSVPAQRLGSGCGCPEGQPASACLSEISLAPDNVRSCFGSTRITVATFALSLLYLTVTCSFAAAVGLLLLSQRQQAVKNGDVSVVSQTQRTAAAPDIFISYVRGDRSKAERLADALKPDGWSIWWDTALLPGESFEAVITERLRTAKCVLVLWSNASVKSDWVRDEANEGKRRGVLVPCLIEHGVLPPIGHQQYHATDLTSWDGDKEDKNFQALRLAIMKHASR